MTLDDELYVEGWCNDPACGTPGKPCVKTGVVFRAPRVVSPWATVRRTLVPSVTVRRVNIRA